jgi:hypothetical protein
MSPGYNISLSVKPNVQATITEQLIEYSLVIEGELRPNSKVLNRISKTIADKLITATTVTDHEKIYLSIKPDNTPTKETLKSIIDPILEGTGIDYVIKDVE